MKNFFGFIAVASALLIGGLVLTSQSFAAPSALGGAGGEALFNSKKCNECHQVKAPAKGKTIQDAMSKKGPELWYAGSKFREGFLKEWLAHPKPIRPMAYYSLTERNKGDHPRLSSNDAASVAEYLMSLKTPEVKPGSAKAADSVKGRVIFEKKLGCYGCHQVGKGDYAVGGLSGPTLIGAGKRLSPEWVYAYLLNPKYFGSVTGMPVFAGAIGNEEMKILAEYVSTL